MPSVGPEVPPHLAKRKRSNSELEDLDSPPQKIIAASASRTLGPTLPPSNPDAVDLDDSSEDEYGPSYHPIKKPSPPGKVVDPSAPPNNPGNVDLNDSSEDEFGPRAQPRTQATTAVARPRVPARRVLGPAPPPANLSEMPSHAANSDASESDDDYGPAPPPAPGSAAEAAMQQQRAQAAESAAGTASSEPAKPARDSWMLVPPSDSDWSARVDPTKLKNRKFATSKGAAPAGKEKGVSAIWTETPAEKQQRLEDEVLGRKEAVGSARRGGVEEGRDREETEEERRTARRIREYNEKNRGKSLMEQHTGKGGAKEEDDPSKRGFDREKDMALGGRLGHGQKKELLAKAADFGSRFQKGKYL